MQHLSAAGDLPAASRVWSESVSYDDVTHPLFSFTPALRPAARVDELYQQTLIRIRILYRAGPYPRLNQVEFVLSKIMAMLQVVLLGHDPFSD